MAAARSRCSPRSRLCEAAKFLARRIAVLCGDCRRYDHAIGEAFVYLRHLRTLAAVALAAAPRPDSRPADGRAGCPSPLQRSGCAHNRPDSALFRLTEASHRPATAAAHPRLGNRGSVQSGDRNPPATAADVDVESRARAGTRSTRRLPPGESDPADDGFDRSAHRVASIGPRTNRPRTRSLRRCARARARIVIQVDHRSAKVFHATRRVWRRSTLPCRRCNPYYLGPWCHDRERPASLTLAAPARHLHRTAAPASRSAEICSCTRITSGVVLRSLECPCRASEVRCCRDTARLTSACATLQGRGLAIGPSRDQLIACMVLGSGRPSREPCAHSGPRWVAGRAMSRARVRTAPR